MPSHPNRSTWRSALPVPTPDEIRRVIGSRTQREIAEIAGASTRTVEDWLSGARRPDCARWELLLLRIKQHPTHELTARKSPRPPDAS